MKILLINPPRVYERGEKPFLVFPLGLGYIAASIGQDIQILDCVGSYPERYTYSLDYCIHGLPVPEIKDKIESIDPDIILIGSAFSNQHDVIVDMLKAIRQGSRKRDIIMGGAHAAAMHRYFIDEGLADYVVLGEGETVIGRLIDAIGKRLLPQIYGVASKIASPTKISGLAECKSLDAIPFPRWESFDMENYITFHHKHDMRKNRGRVMEVITSRGCSVGCSYCASKVIFGSSFRCRSIENLFREIDELRMSYGVTDIHMLDDNILLDKERFVRICKEMARRNLRWSVPNGLNLDLIDAGIIRIMSRCGCDSIYLAVETVNPDILKKYSTKRVSSLKARKMIQVARSYGLRTVGFFIIGFPDEKKEDMKKTISFAAGCGLDEVHISILTPLPGTALEDLAVDKGFSLNAKRANIPLEGMSVTDIERIRNQGYMKFELKRLMRDKLSYLSPENVRRLIRYVGYALR